MTQIDGDVENIEKRSYDFAVLIVKKCTELRGEKHFEIASQMLRSGTSIGANVKEAQAAFSKNDFTYKMAVASKEARETEYWLQLTLDTITGPNKEIDELIEECQRIIRILTAIVKTAQKNRRG